MEPKYAVNLKTVGEKHHKKQGQWEQQGDGYARWPKLIIFLVYKVEMDSRIFEPNRNNWHRFKHIIDMTGLGLNSRCCDW